MRIRNQVRELLPAVLLLCTIYVAVAREQSENNVCPPCLHDHSVDYQNDIVFHADRRSSPPVKVEPPVLDWGKKHLHSVSTKRLKVFNICNQSILTVYQPFLPSSQFLPCNYTEESLRPGEAISIWFAFMPTLVGFSSAHLMLQTSSGGFLIELKGLAVDAPCDTDTPLKVISFHNPYNGRGLVKEITACFMVFYCDLSRRTTPIWQSHTFVDRFSEWVVVDGRAPISLKPYGSWDVPPRATRTVMAMSYTDGCTGRLIGDLRIHVEWPAVNKSDIQRVSVAITFDLNSPVDGVVRDVNEHVHSSKTVFSAAVLLALILVGSFLSPQLLHRRHDPLTNDPGSPLNSIGIGNIKAAENENLPPVEHAGDSRITIRVIKEKARRRRKRRSRNAILGILDAGSSQSSNSTPTSPISTAESPIRGIFEYKEDRDASPEKKEDDAGGVGGPLIPTSTLPPHARAPGWELGKRKGFGSEGKEEDKYKYDIWGEVFAGIDLMGSSEKGISRMPVQSNFSGFFVKGPHTLMNKVPQDRDDGQQLIK